MLGTPINFGKDNDDLDAEADTEVKVMMGHVRWWVSAVNQNQGIVCHSRGDTVYSKWKTRI